MYVSREDYSVCYASIHMGIPDRLVGDAQHVSLLSGFAGLCQLSDFIHENFHFSAFGEHVFRCFLVSDTQVAKVGILGRVDMRQPAFVRLCAALHSISCILGG